MIQRLFPYILVISMFITGCSSSITDVRSDDNFVSRVNASPDIIELDAELNALDIETENLEASYNDIQTNILLHTDLTGENKDVVKSLSIFINDNNILVVNDKAMSRNDFSNFVAKNLPGLCTPSPKLSIHKKANYDTAAWVLEMIYSHGCAKVDIE